MTLLFPSLLTPSLPVLEDKELLLDDLPTVVPHFFVPRLTDTPQDPIMNVLKVAAHNQATFIPPSDIPEVVLLAVDQPQMKNTLWSNAIKGSNGNIAPLLSWDVLRPSYSSRPHASPFLSEQDNFVCAAARYRIQPRLHDPTFQIAYVSQDELFAALRMTVLGIASVLYTWDLTSERFIQSGLGEKSHGAISIDGKDEIISQSLIHRFLTIGTLLRRLEELLASLRTRSTEEGPTIHAFAHSLSTILEFLRNSLTRSSLSDCSRYMALATVWMEYEEFEDILVALSVLLGIEEYKSPSSYKLLESAPVPLLSRIYDHVNIHIERKSSRTVTGIFAFILTSTSRLYFQQVFLSIGLGRRYSNPATRDQYSMSTADEEGAGFGIFDYDLDFPSFFPSELVTILPTASKSLKLLQAAQTDHPLLRESVSPDIRWVWTESDVQAAWNDEEASDSDAKVVKIDTSRPVGASTDIRRSYKAEITTFHIFDLEPGAHLSRPPAGSYISAAPELNLHAFLGLFPESLPQITPTLAHLTTLVLSPLSKHAARLSSTLLSLFLSETSVFNLKIHLQLLRSYLLLSSHSFKSRLATALFSDEDDDQGRKISRRPLHYQSSTIDRLGSGPWAVGLAPSLTERETWPPGGADLSFFLRRVIVDSLDHQTVGDGVSSEVRGRVLGEAESRLGFAIRDLPVAAGRDKWLDPSSIEALDFLYMDYKPPHPLEVLITPEILSKYQRMFAFLLRIMRVEGAIRALFRMTRPTSVPLFPTLFSANAQLLHFRFLAQAFVTALSSYIYDTAIGATFDPFLSQLSSPAPSPNFSDVFALTHAHSLLMDDMLGASLLRSGQKGLGDLLRRALELVLEFTILAGKRKRGLLEEYEAAGVLKDLFRDFRGMMGMITSVLRSLVEKNPIAGSVVDQSKGETPNTPRQLNTMECLHHLLLRLDVGDWWIKVRK